MSYGVHPYAVRFGRLPHDSAEMSGYELEDEVDGRFLTNEHWSGMRTDWFDAVDDALRAAGSEVRLLSFFNRGAPCPVGPTDDFPMIGHVRPDEVETLRAKLTAVVVSGDEGRAVAEVSSWLQALEPGEGLVTFYY